MDWERLLSLKRHGDRSERLRIEQDDTRLGFEVDYDRIIFSSAFRSLQDKTQVVPLPIHMGTHKDFVHTRLTHSLEVSVVGRSLGRIAGKAVLAKYPELVAKGYHFNDFGAIVAAAALAHDIGNPPFGHSGEKAIGVFFETGPGKQYRQLLTETQYQDLIDFEGNANGFKLLTESKEGVPGGLRLSYATLGAFTKYPKASLPKRPTPHISDKKFGYFQTEETSFKDVALELGLAPKAKGSGFHRHPLTYLVEAADDICYTIIDFEDGINRGFIPEEFALEYLIKLVKDNINSSKYHKIKATKDRLAYLRALAINTLIREATEIFIANEEAIRSGNFETALLDKCAYTAQIDDIIKLSIERIYQSPEVIEKELAGYAIIGELLEVYTSALLAKKEGRSSAYHNLLLHTLPEHLQSVEGSAYAILLNTCSYIASLSDSAAVQLHQRILGGVV
ncbi:dGTP triphosphohydrolase [Flagellimonas sp. DF-77]|uniref:dGTP triphosphohydrolase n=1 Tax=Flagellimonas algarum TaxID=3230298 RepID=UPI003391266F